MGLSSEGVKFLCENVVPGVSEIGHGDNKILENMEILLFLHISKLLTHHWKSEILTSFSYFPGSFEKLIKHPIYSQPFIGC